MPHHFKFVFLFLGALALSASADAADPQGKTKIGASYMTLNKAIGRVLAWGSKVIILDEPTAALGVQESRQVLEMIKRMKADGRTIVLITHNMDHVLEVADRVIVMRRGKKVGDLAVGNLQIADIVHLIVAG